MTLKRGKRTLEEVWDTVNGLHHGRSKDRFASRRGRGNAHKKGGDGFLGREGMMPKERGERGVRIGDLEYAQTPLDLGMLDGNRFCIVLRSVVLYFSCVWLRG
jgi:tRNA pseudouridine13 synthase